MLFRKIRKTKSRLTCVGHGLLLLDLQPLHLVLLHKSDEGAEASATGGRPELVAPDAVRDQNRSAPAPLRPRPSRRIVATTRVSDPPCWTYRRAAKKAAAGGPPCLLLNLTILPLVLFFWCPRGFSEGCTCSTLCRAWCMVKYSSLIF